MLETKSTCPYCGVGCGVIIESRGDQITGVRGDPLHPANFGRLCSKGSNLHLTATAAVTMQTRLLHPMQRASRETAPQRISWDAALDSTAQKFAQVIADHGPDAVGFYISGQLLTEDYYVFNKLAKGLIGTNNIDSNSRLCMSSAVAGYKQTLGADAPPACYDDVNHAGCIFIVGSNTAFAHPILFRRIEDAKKANPAMKIIVADPRRTDTVELADLFLPIQPGTDVMLFNGMLHIMLWEGWINQDFINTHTDGFDALKATVRDCTPELTADICGIKKEDLFAAAKMFALGGSSDSARRKATLSLYCQGLNQSSSGTAKNAALINMHLATKQIGKLGAGPLSLTGQPNAMGGREVGGMANLMSGHRDLADPEHRAEVEKLWNVSSVPSAPGKTAVEMFQAAADGQIKVLWIACTNPAQSMPDQALVRRAMERAELVIVQEAFATTSTCAYADILLPATTWGEKEGTVTNTERRISRVRAAVVEPGETRHDWLIAAEFGRRLEKLLPSKAPLTLFDYPTPESVWLEHRESTRGRDLDITGMSYALLEATPLQWPMREGESVGMARLYENNAFSTANGKAQFVNTVYKPVAEPRESRFPFSLTTGRLRDQWHGMSRTGTLGKLFGHVAEPAVQMNVQDMTRRLIKEGDLVHVTSKRGSILLPVQASKEVGMSQAFIAMHWGEEFLSGSKNGDGSNGERLAGVNAITTSAFCPTSKQPELKHAAVKILKAELSWTLLGVAWLPSDQALTAREALKALMCLFPFASCVPFGDNADTGTNGQTTTRTGLLFRAADHEAPSDAVLKQIETILCLGASSSSSQVLRYADKKKGQYRAIKLSGNREHAQLEAFLLAGDTRSEAWIKTLLQESLPSQSYGRMLLLPGSQAPLAVQSRGKPICTCFNITDVAINAQLATSFGSDERRLTELQAALKCGTNCGSCVPELKRMVRDNPRPVSAAGSVKLVLAEEA